jgi:transcriptional regulator with XRE-family HTH domain/uncharacterized phage-associated protein
MKVKKPQGKVSLNKKMQSFEFRKESFPIMYHTWIDHESAEEFTTIELDELNQAQVHNQYRSKHSIPFVDEIKMIREQYGLSAAKMSEVLGLSANVYGNYENGEMPGPATGKFIQLAKNPVEFKRLIELSKNEFDEREIAKVKLAVEKFTNEDILDSLIEERLFGTKTPGNYNGYRVPTMEKIGAMAKYFALKLAPFKTKMNKLLFYADFYHYSKTGYSISGMTYKAITHGPVPLNYGGIYDRLADEGYVEVAEFEFEEYSGEKLINRDGEADMRIFNESEEQALVKVQERLGRLKTNDIIKVSHEELAWQKNIDDHGRISYDYGFMLQHADF